MCEPNTYSVETRGGNRAKLLHLHLGTDEARLILNLLKISLGTSQSLKQNLGSEFLKYPALKDAADLAVHSRFNATDLTRSQHDFFHENALNVFILRPYAQ